MFVGALRRVVRARRTTEVGGVGQSGGCELFAELEYLRLQLGDRQTLCPRGRVNGDAMFNTLQSKGFQIGFQGHARAILSNDFPHAVAEVEAALSDFTIPIEEIIAGGGGEARGTQRLRRALNGAGWRKTTFVVEKRINNIPRESQSHEVDHVREFEDGSRIALEIEWNNKDPFFDRDLENFKRLHADGAISIGMIVTRGQSLHENMRKLVRRFLDEHAIDALGALEAFGYEPTRRQKDAIARRAQHSGVADTF